MKSLRDSAYVKQQRKLNLDPYHVQSCGPEAIQKAFLNFNIFIKLEDLSYVMQSAPSCANLLRDTLAVLDAEARKITFPSEIKSILKKNGFTITSVKNLEELDKNQDTAIILVKQKGAIHYHWACFPIDKDIETFFGKDTVVKEIYLIKK